MILRKTLAALLVTTVVLPTMASAQEPARKWREANRDKGQVEEVQKSEDVRRQGEGRRQRERQVPSATEIQRRLEAPAQKRIRREDRVTIQEFKRRPELRRAAPSIDIQAINFEFGSAQIPYSQYGKVEVIADAIERMLNRRPDAQILIEGHTDAVGSRYSNQSLSEARASSLKRLLVREFGIPSYSIETVGYGEDYLLVPTQYESWENRRVTLRRVDEFIR